MFKYILLFAVGFLFTGAVFFAGVFVERRQPGQCAKWLNKQPVQDALQFRCQYIERVDSVYLFRCDNQLVMIQDV